MKHLIPKTEKTTLQIFKWFTMSDVCVIFVFIALVVVEILTSNQLWQQIIFPIVTSLIGLFLVMATEKGNKTLKNWQWLILFVKFHFFKQTFTFKNNQKEVK